MGGYFGAYVAVNLIAFAAAVWRRRKGATREAIVSTAFFGAVTVVASFVPQSHELRYYMHWMMLLVSMNLMFWTQAPDAPRWAVGFVATSALAVVAWSTGAGYLYASGNSFDDLVAKRVDSAVIESATAGERLCIGRPPYTFLYAPEFHPSKPYAVQEATPETDCKDARRVP